MVALQIRDVPDEVRDRLADAAARGGQSLQAYLLDLVKAEARRARNRELIASLRGRTDGANVAPGDAVALLRRLREERDAQILRAVDQ